MTETTCNAPADPGLAFKYVLRLLTVEQARQFESHFAGCDHCAGRLGEITHFFELLAKSLGKHAPQPLKDPASGLETASAAPTIEELLRVPSHQDSEKMIALFTKCFAGFRKLRKNMASRLSRNVGQDQIDQAAIEILLALPSYVSKIDDAS